MEVGTISGGYLTAWSLVTCTIANCSATSTEATQLSFRPKQAGAFSSRSLPVNAPARVVEESWLDVNTTKTDVIQHDPRTANPSLPHQILQAFSLTIASPFLHPNALANSAIFESGPFPRNLGNGCGFVFASSRAYSSRSFAPQICAQPKKNRCSAVNPSFSGGRGLPSSDFSYAPYAIVSPPRSAMLSPSTSLPFSCRSPSTTYPSN